MSKAMSLKAKIRNIAKQKSIPAQVILQNYMFERLLVRLSMSEYKEKFVLKGGKQFGDGAVFVQKLLPLFLIYGTICLR